MTWVFSYSTPALTEALKIAHNRYVYEASPFFGFDIVKLTIALKRTAWDNRPKDENINKQTPSTITEFSI